MELTEQELHCIARLLQGAVFGKEHGIFEGCHFCKYKCTSPSGSFLPGYVDVMDKLYEITGVDTRVISGARDNPPPYRKRMFPYRRFLRNANDEIKAEFKKWLNDVSNELSEQFLKTPGSSLRAPLYYKILRDDIE